MPAKKLESNEAEELCLALGTAIIQNNKPAREALYADLSEEDLKMIIRHALKMMLNWMSLVARMHGEDVETMWSNFAFSMSAKLADDAVNGEEE